MLDKETYFRCPIDGCPIEVKFVLNGLKDWTVQCRSRSHLCEDRWMCPLNEGPVKLDTTKSAGLSREA